MQFIKIIFKILIYITIITFLFLKGAIRYKDQIFINYLSKIKNLIFNDSFKYNIISYLLFGFYIYKFYNGFSFDAGLYALIISFLISFAISTLLLNKFRYSDNIYLRILQRFLIYNISFIFVSILFIYSASVFNTIPTIECSSLLLVVCHNARLSKKGALRRLLHGSTPPSKKSRNFNYFKLLLFILLLVLTIGPGNVWTAILHLTFSKILFMSIIVSSIYFIFLCIEFAALLYFIIKKDKNIPSYLPSYIADWLCTKKEISAESPLGRRIFVDMYIRCLIGHLICISILIALYLNC